MTLTGGLMHAYHTQRVLYQSTDTAHLAILPYHSSTALGHARAGEKAARPKGRLDKRNVHHVIEEGQSGKTF